MDKFSKDHSLLNGRGEDDISWITANGSHIPIKEGETPKEAVVKHNDKHKEKQDAAKHLVNALRKIKNVKMKEIHSYIKSLDPISLKMNENKIVAEFDKFSADKNIYGHGKSDKEGYNYKLNNPDKLPELIKQSQYTHSKPEEGKKTPAHIGVKQWHYFKKDYKDFSVVVNIRDKGNRKFVYEIVLKKKKV